MRFNLPRRTILALVISGLTFPMLAAEPPRSPRFAALDNDKAIERLCAET